MQKPSRQFGYSRPDLGTEIAGCGPKRRHRKGIGVVDEPMLVRHPSDDPG